MRLFIAISALPVLWFWGIGMIKLAKNDLHPHPSVRTGQMVYVAVTIIAIAIAVPMLHRSHPTAEKIFCASAILAVGLVSYLFNHRWRHAFF